MYSCCLCHLASVSKVQIDAQEMDTGNGIVGQGGVVWRAEEGHPRREKGSESVVRGNQESGKPKKCWQ